MKLLFFIAALPSVVIHSSLPSVSPSRNGIWSNITYDDFETIEDNDDWNSTNFQKGGDDAQIVGTKHHVKGKKAVRIRNGANPDEASFYHSSDHDVTLFSTLRVHFFFKALRFEDNKNFSLEYSSDSGVTWNDIKIWTFRVDFFNNNYYEETVLIKESSSILFNDKVRLRFTCGGNRNLDNIYIDEVAFSGYVVDSVSPSAAPSVIATSFPTEEPTVEPTHEPIEELTVEPTHEPTNDPTYEPTARNGVWSNITYDNFETPQDNDDWNSTNFQKVSNNAQIVSVTPHVYKGEKAARIRNGENSDASFYHSSDHDVTSFSTLRVHFWFKALRFETDESFSLEYSSDSGVTWNDIKTWTFGVDFFNYKYYEETVLITRSSSIEFNDKARLRFSCHANRNLDNIYIDEVAFSGYLAI